LAQQDAGVSLVGPLSKHTLGLTRFYVVLRNLQIRNLGVKVLLMQGERLVNLKLRLFRHGQDVAHEQAVGVVVHVFDAGGRRAASPR